MIGKRKNLEAIKVKKHDVVYHFDSDQIMTVTEEKGTLSDGRALVRCEWKGSMGKSKSNLFRADTLLVLDY